MLCYALDMDCGELFICEIIVVSHRLYDELKIINVKNLAK